MGSRLLNLLLCALLLGPMTLPAWAIARPENRVGKIFSSPLKTASADLEQTAGTRRETRCYVYDFVSGMRIYLYCQDNPVNMVDPTGKWGDGLKGGTQGDMGLRGHSDFPGHEVFDYTDEDKVHSPFNSSFMWRHFGLLRESEPEIIVAIRNCDPVDFQQKTHQMQDFFSHRGQGFHALKDIAWYAYVIQGHGTASVGSSIARGGGFGVARPDNALDYKDAYEDAKTRTQYWFDRWNKCCIQSGGSWVRKPGTTQADLDARPPDYRLGDQAPPPTPTSGYWRRGWNATAGGFSDLMSRITITVDFGF